MSWFEVYALFGGPIVVLIIGIAVAYVAARGEKEGDQKQSAPAE